MILSEKISLMDKLKILSDAAKYDVACTSSGTDRAGRRGTVGNCIAAGICHSFSADGRCISLLKILFTNECVFDCRYCLNRSSNDVPRASFTPDEVCTLTMEFYRRNYIEGLFLSSGILRSPDYTMELLCETVMRLRTRHRFNGYIHLKAIPGASPVLIEQAGYYADRMSVNLELATAEGLRELAPHKTRRTILQPMRQIQARSAENREEIALYRHAPRFVPAGQSTQMIVGAMGESDYQLIRTAESLYRNFSLKRVFYSAFVNVNQDTTLPMVPQGPSLLREHRLYQADWLMRFYGFQAGELLSENRPDFNLMLDPKCDWAIRHLEYFPVEVNRADYHDLLRVPGIGVRSAQKIVASRRYGSLTFDDLKKMRVVLKRAQYFITCGGRTLYPVRLEESYILRNLTDPREALPAHSPSNGEGGGYRQLSLFDEAAPYHI